MRETSSHLLDSNQEPLAFGFTTLLMHQHDLHSPWLSGSALLIGSKYVVRANCLTNLSPDGIRLHLVYIAARVHSVLIKPNIPFFGYILLTWMMVYPPPPNILYLPSEGPMVTITTTTTRERERPTLPSGRKYLMINRITLFGWLFKSVAPLVRWVGPRIVDERCSVVQWLR